MRTAILRPAGLIVLASCLALSACSGGTEDGATSTPTSRPPTEEGRELTSLVEEAQGLIYHATYRIVGGPTDISISVEVWRKGSRVRLDQEQVRADQTVRTSGFRLEGRTIGCSHEGDEQWRCTGVDQPEPSPGDASADPLIGGLVGELSVSDLTVGTEEINGRPARCYKAADESREVCVTTDEGIAVRIATPQSRLELAELERDVDDSIFDPPAEPTESGQPPGTNQP